MIATETPQTDQPSQELVKKEALGLVPQALSIKVIDAQTYDLANTMRTNLKAARSSWAKIMDPICKKAHDAWKTATSGRGEVDGPMEEAEKHLNREMAAHEQRERDKAEVLRRAEEERLRKEEEDRRLAEAQEKERVANEERERAKLAQEESDHLREQGRDAEADEKSEAAQNLARSAETHQATAEALIEAPITTAPVRVETAAPKIAGVSYRDNWKAEGQDIKATIKAAAEGNVLAIAALTFNTTAINQSAKAMKAEYQVPGIKVWNERTLVDRGAN